MINQQRNYDIFVLQNINTKLFHGLYTTISHKGDCADISLTTVKKLKNAMRFHSINSAKSYIISLPNRVDILLNKVKIDGVNFENLFDIWRMVKYDALNEREKEVVDHSRWFKQFHKVRIFLYDQGMYSNTDNRRNILNNCLDYYCSLVVSFKINGSIGNVFMESLKFHSTVKQSLRESFGETCYDFAGDEQTKCVIFFKKTNDALMFKLSYGGDYKMEFFDLT